MNQVGFRDVFSQELLDILDSALHVAEESVADFYKMSTSQWARLRYDVQTAATLLAHEHVAGVYAQVLRYVGMPWRSSTSASAFTVYRICLQDGLILHRLREDSRMAPLPFLVFILVHELVHVVRFSSHLQLFDASLDARMQEESRVEELTHTIVRGISLRGMGGVCSAFAGAERLMLDPVVSWACRDRRWIGKGAG